MYLIETYTNLENLWRCEIQDRKRIKTTKDPDDPSKRKSSGARREFPKIFMEHNNNIFIYTKIKYIKRQAEHLIGINAWTRNCSLGLEVS